MALYSLARLSEEQSDADSAMQFAARCYRALLQRDSIIREDLLEMLFKRWPELTKDPL